ncbi:MAG: hypothetical protein H0X63_12050 [Flavobacteriales bacterium]|nr:hypothetical protein [Flavobacteriales bacterium]
MNFFPEVKRYEIGYFVVLDIEQNLVGKIIFSGPLKSIEAKFVPLVVCRVDAMCRSLFVTEKFDLEVDDWYGLVDSVASNYLILESRSLPVFWVLGKFIGRLVISGYCDKITVVFIPSVKLVADQLEGITVESRPSERRLRR